MSYPCFNQAVLINVVTAMSSCGMTRAWPLAWIQNWMKGQKVVNNATQKKGRKIHWQSVVSQIVAWPWLERLDQELNESNVGQKLVNLPHKRQKKDSPPKCGFSNCGLTQWETWRHCSGRKLKNRPLFRKRNTSNMKLKTTKKQQTKNHQRKAKNNHQKSDHFSGMIYILTPRIRDSSSSQVQIQIQILEDQCDEKEVVIH